MGQLNDLQIKAAQIHADQTRRQIGDEFEQFGAWYLGGKQPANTR